MKAASPGEPGPDASASATDSESIAPSAFEFEMAAWRLARSDGRPLIHREALALVLLMLAPSDAARDAMSPHLRAIMSEAFSTWP